MTAREQEGAGALVSALPQSGRKHTTAPRPWLRTCWLWDADSRRPHGRDLSGERGVAVIRRPPREAPTNAHARRSDCAWPLSSATLSALCSVQTSPRSSDTTDPSPPAAASPYPITRTLATHAALASLHPPYAVAGSPATRVPRRAAWRASWRHYCCPAVSASRAKSSALRRNTQAA